MTPTKYRKKPVVIEAMQFNGGPNEVYTILEWMDHGDSYWSKDEGLYILTLEGEMHVTNGDFIIKGVQGEFYPCKPDIFAQTYEEVAE